MANGDREAGERQRRERCSTADGIHRRGHNRCWTKAAIFVCPLQQRRKLDCRCPPTLNPKGEEVIDMDIKKEIEKLVVNGGICPRGEDCPLCKKIYVVFDKLLADKKMMEKRIEDLEKKVILLGGVI